jgi:hypothetical protein
VELSHAEIRSLLSAALPDGEWIDEIYDSHVISAAGTGLLRRDYQIDANRAVQLGEASAVRRDVSYKPVFSFSVSPQAYAAVVRTGKLFEAQFFAERGYGVTEEELDEIVAGFSGAPILIQHESTIFDRLPDEQRPGWVTRLWRKGRELFGEVRLADWLHQLFADQPIRVSVGLTTDRPRRLLELSLVPNPRITDAAVMAAFSSFAREGRDHGQPPGPNGGNQPSMEGLTKEDVGFLQGLKKFFGGGEKPDPVEARFAALEAKLDALNKPAAPAQPAPVDHSQAANTFADRLIAEGRLFPADRQKVVDGYAAVAPAGEAAVQAFASAFASRPASLLASPMIPGTPAKFELDANGEIPIQVDVKKRLAGGRS